MSIQAKLQCTNLMQAVNQESPVLTAVTATSEENKRWAKYTPSGRLELTITNPAAFGFFEPGDEYLVTIEKVAK